MKLFYYSNMAGKHGWFKNPANYYASFGKQNLVIRTAHAGIEPPAGYHKPNGHLANDAVEPVPTMRDFIHAMTP